VTIRIKPIEVATERWVRGSTRAISEALASGQTHARIAWAVSFSTSSVRTVSRRAGQSGQITLPAWVMRKLGVLIGDRIVLELTSRNAVELRRATEDDLPEIARAAVERADRLLPARQAKRELKYFNKRCEQCGEPYRARRAFQRFCPPCGRLRHVAASRAYERSRAAERSGAGQAAAEKTVARTGSST
jgi:antitoxin component of MazEF toxin-antitoxin module